MQTDQEWVTRANCRRKDIDPDIFFSKDPDQVMLALTLCGRCLERVTCREDWSENVPRSQQGYAIVGNTVFS